MEAKCEEQAGGDRAGTTGLDGDDYEEYEDFSELPETRSIVSDDSFYPPLSDSDESDDWSLGESETSESPPPLSLFRACCTNNVLVLRALIRQGLEEDAVKETDRNKRVREAGRGKQHAGGRPGRKVGKGAGPGRKNSMLQFGSFHARHSYIHKIYMSYIWLTYIHNIICLT